MNSPCEEQIGQRVPRRLRFVPERLDKFFRKLLFLIPIGIIGNVVYCLVTTDRQALASIVHFHAGYLLLAALLSIVPWFTGSLRMFTWSRFLGQSLSYRDAFGIVLAAELGAAIAPPMIGGGAVKIGMLMNRGFNMGTALSLPVLENLEDTLFFLIMVPLALTITASWDLPLLFNSASFHHASWWFMAIFVALCAILLVLAVDGKRRTGLEKFREKVRLTIRNFQQTFYMIGRGGKKVLLLTLVLTAVQWICRYSIISLLLAGLGIPVRPVLFMVLQVLVFALTILVPSPGGAGGAEFIFSLLYTPFLPTGTIGLATTGWRFFTFYLQALLAALLSLCFGLVPARGKEPPGAPETAGSLPLKEELSFVSEQPS